MGSKSFESTIHTSNVPVKGFSFSEAQPQREPTLDEMLDELERSDVRDIRKEQILSKIRGRYGSVTGSEKKETAERNPKRYLVDPETGVISVDEEEGELTYKDALLISASKKSKGGNIDDFIKLFNLFKEENNQPKTEEKKKEFYVDQETGLIVHDAENGEYSLSEARAVSQSMQKAKAGSEESKQSLPNYYIDQDGNLHQLEPGQPAVIKQSQPQPSKTYMVDAQGNVREHQPNEPIVIRVEQPANNNPGLPMAMDKDGNPLSRNLDELISWHRFQSEEKRADERAKGLMDLIQLSKENVPVAIQAIQRAVAEQGASEQGPIPPEPQTPPTPPPTHQCEKCGTNFGIRGGEWAFLACPGCGKQYSREELLGSSEGEQQ